MTDEWITGKEVVALTRGGAGHQLQQYLVNGLISGRCKVANLLGRGSYGEKIQKRDWEVPSEVWSGSTENSALQLLQDKFTTRATGTGFRTVELIGLSFLRSEVMEAFHLTDAAQSKMGELSRESDIVGKRKGGKTPSKIDWSNFAAALAVVVAFDDTDVAEPGRSVASVYERVGLVLQANLGPDGSYLSIDSVQDTIALAQDWLAKGMPTNS